MVRILALLLSLLPTPALAQAEFSTIISPVLGTSPLAVTVGVSPFGVICVAGCASAGASPSSVIVTNVPTVSLWTSPAVVNINTIPIVTTSAVAGAVAVNINNTPTVSLASSPFVQQGTNPWTVNGTVSASLTTSPAVVNINTIPTVTTSPVAGGSYPVTILGTPSVVASLSTSAPYVNINTIPTVTTSAVAGAIAVNVNNTPTVSLASSPFVQQGTSPWTVTFSTSPVGVVCVSGCASAGASPSSVIASLSTSAPYVNINTIPTVTTSAVAGAVAVNINNTVTVSQATSAPFVQQGTATWTVNLPTSPITVGTMTSGAVVNVMAAGTSALAVTPIISPVAVIVTSSFTNVVSPLAVLATSAAVTNVMAAGTSPLAVTLTSSPTAIAEQNGNAYPNRANWLTSSLSTASTGNQVLMNAPAANKLYITGLNCARSDTGGQMMTLAFNITLKNGTSFYMVVPPLSGSAQTNMSFQTPLQVAATTSLQFTPNISVAALLCNAEGFNAP